MREGRPDGYQALMPTHVRDVLTRILVPLAVLTVVMIGIGLLATKGLAHSWPFTAEDEVNRQLSADRTRRWDEVTTFFSVLASTPAVIAVTAVVAGVMRLVFKRWRESLFLAGAVAAQSVVFLLTTIMIDRSRPAVPHLDASPPTSSFPSGHTSAALCLYGGIAVVLALHARHRRLAPILLWVLLLAVPVAVALSRVYRGMHHPSDVVASFVNGITCLTVMARAILTSAVRWSGEHVPGAVADPVRRRISREA